MENPADIIYISLQSSMGESGRHKAMTRIWNVYGKGLYYFISKSFQNNSSLCDDCFQEVMLKIYLGLEKYSYGYHLKPWLYTIARNCSLDYIRRDSDFTCELNSELFLTELPGPEECHIKNDLSSAIKNSINGLEVDDSRIAFLRFYENLKLREIAQIMCMNENTVKTRIVSIKKKLRTELAEWI